MWSLLRSVRKLKDVVFIMIGGNISLSFSKQMQTEGSKKRGEKAGDLKKFPGLPMGERGYEKGNE